MPLLSLGELKTALPRDRRLMGLDLGTKTIGLALSDVRGMVASPYETLRRTKFQADARELGAIIGREEVNGLVLGLPVSMNGSEGPRCQSTRQFARNFLKIADLPLCFWDERLSTAAVERMLVNDVDMTRRRRAEVVDKLAAAYILQGALDALEKAE